MTFLKVWMSHTYTHGMTIGSSFIFIYRVYTLTPFLMVVVLMALFSGRGTQLHEMSLYLPQFKHFLFPSTAFLYLLGLLLLSSWLSTTWPTAFLSIIYCVHWFHLNSIICTKCRFPFFIAHSSAFVILGIKVLRCGICWPLVSATWMALCESSHYHHSSNTHTWSHHPTHLPSLCWTGSIVPHCRTGHRALMQLVQPRCGAAIPNKWHISFSMTGSL